MRRCINSTADAGFTLLETLLALTLTAMLVGGLYTIASGTTQLSSEVSQFQEEQLTGQAFSALCRQALGGLSPTASIRLRSTGQGNRSGTAIVVSGDPSAFAFNRVLPGSTAVVLSSHRDAGGTFSVDLRYLAASDIEAFDRGSRDAGRTLPLLEEVRQFDWRFFDRRGDRWKPAWNFQDERPALAELTLALKDQPPTRHVFFIPELQAAPLPLPRAPEEIPTDDDN